MKHDAKRFHSVRSKQKNDMTEDLDDQANRITAKVERVSEKAKKNYNDLNNVITIDVMSLEVGHIFEFVDQGEIREGNLYHV